MPELGKAIVFFVAFCAVMGWAVIELLIWLFSSIWAFGWVKKMAKVKGCGSSK